MPIWFSALAAFGMTFFGCWFISQSVRLKNIGNVAPTEDRWHQTITPGLGGIPIYIGFVSAALLAGTSQPSCWVIILSALPLLIAGTYDDLKPIAPKTKLVVQLISATVFLVLMARYGALGGSLIQWLVCCIWLVAIINAINLLDNMDGLAAGVALIACLTIAYLLGKSDALSGVSYLYHLLAASIAAFLSLNRHPAKLFMGDAGALWLGFAVGAGVVLLMSDIKNATNAESASSYVQHWSIALLICAVPISDTLMVMITRKLRGQAVSIGGRDHLSHRLVAIGLSDKTGVAMLWLVALIASLLAIGIHRLPSSNWIAIVLAFVAVQVACIVWLTSQTPVAESTTAS